MKLLLVIIAATGLFSMMAAVTASHAIYVQAKVIKAECAGETCRAKVDSVLRFTDETCLLFGILGAIQLGCAIICFRLENNKMRSEGWPNKWLQQRRSAVAEP